MIETVERVDPPMEGDERTMLDAWLDFHRATLWNKCVGLSDEQLKQRAIEPSSITLLGLIRHMTEVERGWFSRTLSAEQRGPIYYSDDDPDGDFDNLDSHPVKEVFALFREECDQSRTLTSKAESLDVLSQHRRGGGDPSPSLRWIITHMIEEYARHNGHADFLRELIDGETGD